MKQESINILRGQLERLFLLIVLFVTSASISANAVETTPIEFDTDYEMSGLFVEHRYSIVASEAGYAVVKCNDGGVTPQVYTDSEFSNELTSEFTYTSTGGQRVFATTANTTYYLKAETNSSTTRTFRVEMLKDLSLESVSPEAGTTFEITGTGQFTARFSMNVSIDGATMTVGTNTKSLTRANSSANPSVLLELKTVIGDMLKSGAAKAGDKFTVKLTGVHATDNESYVYGDDGTLTVEYIMPEMPTTLDSKSMPSTFLSYWAKGDADAVMTLTFSDNLYSGSESNYTPTAALSYGNLDKAAEGEYYYETLPVTVSGNTLTVDFSDKIRTPQTMTPLSDSIYSSVAVKIANVRDSEGTLCYTGQTSTVGSFTFSMPYELVSATDVVTEFTPASGESLATYDNVELYIAGESALRYDGANFAYDNNGKADTLFVANDQITRATEDDAVVLTIPVPTAAKTAKNVTLSLTNLVSIDGIDHKVEATYNPAFKLTLVKPESTELTGFAAGDSLIVTTNMSDEIGCMTFQIFDLTPTDPDDACLWSKSYMTKDVNATTGDIRFTYEILAAAPMIKGHTYQLDFVASASEADARKKNYIGVDTLYLTGLTAAYEYSPYELVGIDPSPDSTVIESVDQRVFDIEFTGPVNINSDLAFIVNGSGSTSPLESITPTDEGASSTTQYSKKWRLTVSLSTMQTVVDNLPLSVAAEDEQGRRVKGNTGKEANTYFSFGYDATIGIPDISVTPYEGSTLTEIQNFSAYYSGGLNLSYFVNDNEVVLYNAKGEEVAHVASSEQYVPDSEMDNWDYIPTQVNFSLSSKVTDAGEYTLVIPAGYFVIGSDFYTYNSKAMTLKYTIGGEDTDKLQADLMPTSVFPDTLSTTTLSELINLELNFEDQTYINESQAELTPAAVYSADGRTLVTTCTLLYPGIDVEPVPLHIYLDEPITEAGVYKVIVPEGLIGDSICSQSQFAIGHCNPEYVFTYQVGTVSNKDNITANPADGSTVISLSRILLTFNDASVVAPAYDPDLEIELRDESGNKVVGATSDVDWNIEDWTVIPVDLDSEVTEKGTYTLHIPAGFYLLNDGEYSSSEINLTYTIGTPAEPEKVEADPADGSTVTSLSHIVLTFDVYDVAPSYDSDLSIDVLDSDGNRVMGATSEIDWDLDWNMIPVDLESELTTNGSYTVHIPEGFYVMNDGSESSDEINLHYIVSNASAISRLIGSYASEYNVYTVNGQEVMTHATATDLSKLSRGLYIINGIKVVVK